MPKFVDHDQRREQIVDGLIRLAEKVGLHLVTIRAVAAEAGVSLRLVQYYFSDKDDLMHQALLRLEQRSNERWERRFAKLPATRSVRQHLDAFVAEALPTDKESKSFHMLWLSFAVLSLTDTRLAAVTPSAGPKRLRQRLIALFTQATVNGELPPEIDVALQVDQLLALNHGLGTSILLGVMTAKRAIVVMTLHLDQVFRSQP